VAATMDPLITAGLLPGSFPARLRLCPRLTLLARRHHSSEQGRGSS